MSYLDQYNDFVSHHFFGYMVFSVVWIFGWIFGSVFYRKFKGKTIFVNPPAQPLFTEKWTSGRSMRNKLTRMGGGRNCLFVAVTKDRVIIRPHFPFSLLFLPEIYGLECDIPKAALGNVQMLTGGLMGKRMLVEFTQANGSAGKMELKLRNPGPFEKAIAEMKAS